MGSSKIRWKFSFRRSTLASISPLPSFTAEMSVEFLCPISLSIMVDPVITSSGHTFGRSYIQACLDLAFAFAPPDLSLDLQPSNPPSSPGAPAAVSLLPEAVVALVRRLMPQDFEKHSMGFLHGAREGGQER
ncbi:U-box domain-containing protein 39-like isoform X2 [Canna indica]|uniref:U-box domain-containing protein 39-like isoform X2 n=1 Tax=Canna indica TaxID=4628 RepID=A0AAQ3JZ57_9LILI|nr:U-box domain-containing protein 39-like isoform X2 [Canna indica]